MDHIPADERKLLRNLFDKTSDGLEFEIKVMGVAGKYMSYEQYVTILKYIKYLNKANKLVSTNVDELDIIYSKDTHTSYRISINNIDEINNIMEIVHKRKNHVIFSTILRRYLDMREKNDKADRERLSYYNIMKKSRDSDNIVDINDLYLRAKLSEESVPTAKELTTLTKLEPNDMNNVIYRLKQRASVYVSGTIDSDKYVRIDLTNVRQTKLVNNINTSIPNYELEVEFMGSKPDDKSFDLMMDQISTLIKLIQQSNFIITDTLEKEVIQYYGSIVGNENATQLDGRNAFSLEIQYLIDTIPNKYAVTDKADGERCFGIIMNNHVYFITQNMHVKDSGIDLPNSASSYNGTILDGELIFLPKKNRHIFMVFDCLFKGGDDIRPTQEHQKRIEHADEVILKCFTIGKQQNYDIRPYANKSDNFNIDDICAFHEKQIKQYMDALNHDIDIEKRYPLIRRKYFIACYGAKPWEIHRYSLLMWNKYTIDQTIKCPYLLDGLIYHPLVQAYVPTNESKYVEYKWKPPTKNSIDFFIQFERDPRSGKVMNVYDNSYDTNDNDNGGNIRNKPYRILKLFVGKKGRNGEEPALFREHDDGYLAHLLLNKHGEVVDVEGNLLSDRTVVEFYYDTSPSLTDRFRWIPLRTRYDKTEQVLRYRRKYGNYVDVADKVWRSIVNPILVADFEDLAKGNDEAKNQYYYDSKTEVLKSKIGHDIIAAAQKDQVYFQKVSDIAKDLRQFHNWIKSSLIYTYGHQMYRGGKLPAVLDIACGKGQDLLKFHYISAKPYVGVEIDREALYNSFDGAISRYEKFSNDRRRYAGFPTCYFIQADAGAPLSYDHQVVALGGMSKENKDNMERFFPSNKPGMKFDIVNCQFALHYFLKNIETWTNFKANIRNAMANGAFFMATTFDALLVNDLFKDSPVFNVSYTDKKGNRKTLFEIVNKYGNIDVSKHIGVGQSIDVYNSWFMEEGNYQTEYLVDKRFVISELARDCDLVLIDTGTFGDIIKSQKQYLTKYSIYDKKNAFQAKVGEYFDNSEINVGSRVQSNLFRYYVFQCMKSTSNKPETEQPISNKKHNKHTGGATNILDNITVQRMTNPDSLYKSIHYMLKRSGLVPKTEEYPEFYANRDIKIYNDDKVTSEVARKIGKKIVILHAGGDSDAKVQKLLNGVDLFILEKDCDGDYDVDYLGTPSKPNAKAIVLEREGSIYSPVLFGDARNNILTRNDDIYNDLKNRISKYAETK